MLNAKELKIHQSLIRACAEVKSSTEAIVVTLFTVARSKLFRKLKRRDLVEYIVEELKIDSTFTFDLNRVVRAGLEYPDLGHALRDGRLTVSKATRILSVLTAPNVKCLIDYATTHTFAETNSFVAGHQPEQGCRETWKQLSADQFKVNVVLTAEQFKALKRVQSLEAQKQKSSKMGDAVAASLSLYLMRNDPVQKAQRSTRRKAKRVSIKCVSDQAASDFDQPNREPDQTESVVRGSNLDTHSTIPQDCTVVHTTAQDHELLSGRAGEHNTRSKLGKSTEASAQNALAKQTKNLVQTTKTHARVRFTAAEVHAVQLKSGGQCCLIGRDGKRCECDRWLEIHHIIPVSQGGTNDIDNLTHLCGKHHDLIHQEVLPLDDQVTWWTLKA